MKKALVSLLVVAILMIASPASAYEPGRITITAQPVDYIHALAGIAQPVSNSYTENERYAMAVSITVPPYYDVSGMTIVVSPEGCTVETGAIEIKDGTYFVTGTILSQNAKVTVTIRDDAIGQASTASQLWQAIYGDRSVSATASFSTNLPAAGSSCTPPSTGIPQTGDRAGVAGLALIVAAAVIWISRKKAMQ